MKVTMYLVKKVSICHDNIEKIECGFENEVFLSNLDRLSLKSSTKWSINLD